MGGRETRTRGGVRLWHLVALSVALMVATSGWWEGGKITQNDHGSGQGGDADRMRSIVMTVGGNVEQATVIHNVTGAGTDTDPFPVTVPWRSRRFDLPKGYQVILTVSRPGSATIECSIIQDDQVRATDSHSTPGPVGCAHTVD